MADATLKPGDRVRFWRLRHAEHGTPGELLGVAEGSVMVRWDAPPSPYLPTIVPPERIISETDYQARKRRCPAGWLWS